MIDLVYVVVSFIRGGVCARGGVSLYSGLSWFAVELAKDISNSRQKAKDGLNLWQRSESFSHSRFENFLLPKAFGFSNELRRGTSEAASALLLLSHWEVLPEDPFFVAKTEEEKEEFGDGSSVLPNTVRKLIDNVRRRKDPDLSFSSSLFSYIS